MALQPGTNVSKAVTYSVLGRPKGTNISKAVTYSVLGRTAGTNISKAVVYTILKAGTAPSPTTSQNFVWGA